MGTIWSQVLADPAGDSTGYTSELVLTVASACGASCFQPSPSKGHSRGIDSQALMSRSDGKWTK